jgi:hypothetical protein
MWFGTRDYAAWIQCPSVEMPSSKEAWNSTGTFLNGGAYGRSSTAAHKRYNMSWGIINRDEARKILDFADRLYGDGPFYWVDPFVAEYNMLPQWFASPSQGITDGIPLNGDVRGTAIGTPDNTNGYPVKSIVYTVNPAVPTVPVWVPIPPGYRAWVGAHGSDGTGGTVQVRPTTGPTSYDTTYTLTLLPVTSTIRVDATFGGGAVTGIELSLAGSGTITLSGIMVQILPVGVTPEPGGFISGQGHSGCSFVEQPEYVPYSAAFDKASLAAEFIETEGWRVA